jgi:hypothetical protein
MAAFACEKNTRDTNVGSSTHGDQKLAEWGGPSEPKNEPTRVERFRAEDRPEHAIGGGPTDTQMRFSSSVAKIAGARCDREMRCGNVGPNEKYPSRSECVAKVQADKRDDINSNECTLGISTTGLNDCLRAIRDEDCGNPIDAVARLNACRTGNICLK